MRLKILIITLLTFTLLTGCKSEKKIDTVTSSNSTNIQQTNSSNNEQKGFNIEITKVTSLLGNAKLYVKISNEGSKSIFVNPYNFTLAHSSGSVEKLKSSTIDGITLEQGQYTSGYLEFIGFDNEKVILSYNGIDSKQKFEVEIPKSQ